MFDPLSESAQAALRQRYAGVPLSEIDRYHWYDLPDGTVLKGGWDLRSSWREYLGSFDFSGKRVLEVGPAAGFISLMLERDGAEVVALDLPSDQVQDLISVPGKDADALRAAALKRIERFKAAWWTFHKLFNSKNKAVYANIYDLPSTLGRFDVSLFAAVLLHMQNPYEALRQAARLTDGWIIVTDLLSSATDGHDHLQFNPADQPWHWWSLSPDVVCKMLKTLSFQHQEISRHHHLVNPDDATGRPIEQHVRVDTFTVVAARTPFAKPA